MSVAAVKPETDEVVAAIKEDGFALVERLIDADRAAGIRKELTEILEKTPEGRNAFEGYSTRRIYALFAKTRVFDDLATHPLLLGVLDGVLGESYQGPVQALPRQLVRHATQELVIVAAHEADCRTRNVAHGALGPPFRDCYKNLGPPGPHTPRETACKTPNPQSSWSTTRSAPSSSWAPCSRARASR